MVSQQTVNLWLKSIGGSSPSQRIIILANCSITEATMKNHSYTKESLSEAVAQSKSVIGVLRFLGVALTSGGVHNHVTKRIKEFGLDTSHFRPWTGENIKDRQRGLERKKNWQDVLVLRIQGTRCKSYMLRRAMIESGIDYKCRECGLSQWRGKPLSLEAEHRNGDPLDDRRENVEFLCPNCHTQTDTYCRQKHL